MTGPDYIVLAHSEPSRVERLVRRLMMGDNRFFLHYERRAPRREFDELRERLEGTPTTYLKRRAGRWGRFGIVAATVDGLRAFVAHGESSYAVMVSGSDYPVKTTRAIAEHFSHHAGESFIDTWPIPKPGWSRAGGIGRYDRWYLLPNSRWPVPPARLVPSGRGPRRLPCGLRPFGGSQWGAFSRPSATMITEYLEANPTVMRFFHTTHLPDELMVPTILNNSIDAAEIRPSVHYVDWSSGGTHPRPLGPADADALVASRHLYARKFVDSEGPDELDRLLGHG